MLWIRRLRRSVFVVALSLMSAGVLHAQGPDPVASPMAHDMAWGRATFVLTEALEIAPDVASRPLTVDVVGWTGGATRRLWFKVEGGAATVGQGMHAEAQVLYGKMISPWWDAQIGLRSDVESAAGTTQQRVGAVLALQGLAPGWFEVEPSLSVNSEGRVSLDFAAAYDLYVAQRLVVQPRFETSFGTRDDVEFGIGRGVGSTTMALRARYEIWREFAPYVGVVWERRFGRTAELVGGPSGESRAVAGLRLWW